MCVYKCDSYVLKKYVVVQECRCVFMEEQCRGLTALGAAEVVDLVLNKPSSSSSEPSEKRPPDFLDVT